MDRTNRRPAGKLVFGASLVLIGILLLLDNLNIFYIDDFFEIYWPLFMIIPGIYFIFKTPPSVIGGSTLVIFGLYFQLRELGIIYYPYTKITFPSFLIFLGILLIVYSRFFRNKFNGDSMDSNDQNYTGKISE